jgi:hypothetical protein
MKGIIFASLTLSLTLGLCLTAQANTDDKRNPAPPAVATGTAHRPDLVVWIDGPQRAQRGDEIGRQITVRAGNRGDVPAPGTDGRIDPDNGYVIDLVLSTEAHLPERPATVSGNFREDMLLVGGRISRTYDIASDGGRNYPVGAEIPRDTPGGRYFICARIDPYNRVAESNEHNNTACFAIQIQPPPPAVGIGNGGRGDGVPHYHIGDRPDLIVSEFSISPVTPVQGEPVSVRVGVYNQGNQHTGSFTVQWWPGENYREPAKTWHVDGVRARGGRILTFTYGGYPSWYGQIRTKVVADAAGEISESEERNNTGTLTISVRHP